MKLLRHFLIGALLCAFLHCAGAASLPVTRGASPEAVRLLDYLYSIAGKGTLAGQHNMPFAGSKWLDAVRGVTGRYPALCGFDFGFGPPGDPDGTNFRQQLVDEAIRRYREGFIITIMWHAVRPTQDEPGIFEQSVEGKLTDAQWRDLMTPGTEIRQRWESQVDVIASYLQQLRDAGVPVLWRPYHEMNGGWFWWGQKMGSSGYKNLWRMLYERLVVLHKLNNLIWVYDCNEVTPGVHSFDSYFPGRKMVDVFAVDVYNTNFDYQQYDRILRLARGKPIALGEVGVPPSAEVLRNQPGWTWFMEWYAPNSKELEKKLAVLRVAYEDPRVMTYTELPWVSSRAPTGAPAAR